MEVKSNNDNKKADSEHKEAGLRVYITIWLSLLMFTFLTVTVASLNLGKLAIIACLAIAAVKSTLVLLYFMHLRYEKRMVIKILIPLTIVILAIFIGLTYSDVMTR